MKKILLDTNAFSAFLVGDEKVLSHIIEADVVYMSIFVIAELLTGFKGGSKETKNSELLNNFLSKSSVTTITATLDTSIIFAEIKNSLKKSGHPLPVNDIWIAAHTKETDSLLITYDNHFRFISGINLWNYTGD